MDGFFEDFSRTKKIENWNLNLNELKKYVDEEMPPNYSALMDCIYKFYTLSNLSKSVEFFGDKNNFYLKSIDLLNDLYDDAKFIYIVRDGRSVAASYKALNRFSFTSDYAPELPVDTEAIAVEWRDNIAAVNKSLCKLDSQKYYTIRFEDLVLRPEYFLQEICHFLKVDFDQAMLDYFLTTVREGLEPPEFSQWKSKNTMPLQKDEILKYQSLGDADLKVFEKIASVGLSQYQYISSN